MCRRILAIAGNTTRDVMRQGLFCFVAGGGLFLVLCSFFFTLFAFGEELRMIREMGISTIVVCCLFLASLSAANTISKEIEMGTIVMLLSKPVDKHSVILGKFFGILAAVSSVFIVMGTLLTVLLCVRESLDQHIGFLASFAMAGYPTVFQLVFSFLPVAIMCAAATAGSVYLNLISNLCCCMVIYIVGNLAGFFHDLFPSVSNWSLWCLSLIYAFIPDLEDIGAIGMGAKVEFMSYSYMGSLLIYAVLYIAFVITLAIEFFEKKECR
ncbi:MAG: ABC transporter permease subunit [Candidatus Brocadiaceae bacterium]|nr:ABC transporter permease subunit [Candidatus Brocadiaceae bacterium]